MSADQVGRRPLADPAGSGSKGNDSATLPLHVRRKHAPFGSDIRPLHSKLASDLDGTPGSADAQRKTTAGGRHEGTVPGLARTREFEVRSGHDSLGTRASKCETETGEKIAERGASPSTRDRSSEVQVSQVAILDGVGGEYDTRPTRMARSGNAIGGQPRPSTSRCARVVRGGRRAPSCSFGFQRRTSVGIPG